MSDCQKNNHIENELSMRTISKSVADFNPQGELCPPEDRNFSVILAEMPKLRKTRLVPTLAKLKEMQAFLSSVSIKSTR